MVPVAASIRSRLSEDENNLRAALLGCLVDAQAPLPFAAAGSALGWHPDKVIAAGKGLVAKKLFVLDAEERVQFAYPVSAVPTSHKVILADGRTLYAMCAIDALGCCFTFGQPVVVESICQLCGRPLRIAVASAEQVVAEPPTAYAVHVDLDKYEDWATKT
jgi:hypothetical protein